MKTQKQTRISKYWESNGFKLGKCYEHPNGRQIYVCGEADTLVFGKTLMVEVGDVDGKGSFNWQPIDLYDDYREEFRWFEISIDKFQLCNYNNSDEEIQKLINGIKYFERKKKLKSIKNKIHN